MATTDVTPRESSGGVGQKRIVNDMSIQVATVGLGPCRGGDGLAQGRQRSAYRPGSGFDPSPARSALVGGKRWQERSPCPAAPLSNAFRRSSACRRSDISRSGDCRPQSSAWLRRARRSRSSPIRSGMNPRRRSAGHSSANLERPRPGGEKCMRGSDASAVVFGAAYRRSAWALRPLENGALRGSLDRF